MRTVLLGIVMLGVVLSGCTSDADEAATGAADDAGKTENNLDFASSAAGVTFDAAGFSAAAEANGASATQLALFEDGVLTFAEYELALLDTFDCARAAGVEVVEQGVQQTSDGYPRLSYLVPMESGGLDAEATAASFESCYLQHGRSADIAWQLGNDPDNQSGVFEAKLDALAECLDANGVPTAPGSISQENLPEAMAASERIVSEGGPSCVIESGIVD